MSKYVIEFDTETKSGLVTKDGVEVENFSHLYFAPSYESGKYDFELCESKKNDDGSYTYIRTTADEKYPVSDPQVSQKELVEFLSSKK